MYNMYKYIRTLLVSEEYCFCKMMTNRRIILFEDHQDLVKPPLVTFLVKDIVSLLETSFSCNRVGNNLPILERLLELNLDEENDQLVQVCQGNMRDENDHYIGSYTYLVSSHLVV